MNPYSNLFIKGALTGHLWLTHDRYRTDTLQLAALPGCGRKYRRADPGADAVVAHRL